MLQEYHYAFLMSTPFLAAAIAAQPGGGRTICFVLGTAWGLIAIIEKYTT